MSYFLNFPLFSIIVFALKSGFVNAEPIKWLSPDVLRQIQSIKEEIIKPSNDKRDYRHILLKNDMQILLISDQNSTMGGASLTVRAGPNSDPIEYQGMAGLLQRMLFRGSKKNPRENSLREFVSGFNGYSSSGMGFDETTYSFTILSAELFKALDIFFDHFVAPLLPENLIQREIEVMDSAFNYDKKTDSYRKLRLFKSLSHKNHDFNKLILGNRISLKDDPTNKSSSLHQALVKFHEQYYSSNLMTLVVVSNFSLEHLTQQVVPLFSQIPNKKVKRPTWPNPPYDSLNVGYQVNMVSLMEKKLIEIRFPVPHDSSMYYNNLVMWYTPKLLERRGPGCLIDELKSRHLALSLTTICEIYYYGFFITKLQIEATDEGFSRIDDIVSIVFNYIDWMKKQPLQEWIFRDLEKITLIDFKFQDQMNLKRSLQISRNLQNVNPKECIIAYPKYRPDLILKLFQQLDVFNFNLFLIAKNFTNMTFQKEEWTGVEYNRMKISPERMKRFQQPFPNMKPELPGPNLFLPSNLSLVSADDDVDSDKNETPYKFPQIIFDSNTSRAWYKQDLSFRSPKAKIYINFYSPLIKAQPVMIALLRMYVFFISDKAIDYLDPVTESGVHFKLESFDYGLTYRIDGYVDKMDLIIQTFMKVLLTEKISETDFTEAKLKVTRDLENSDKAGLFDISLDHFFLLTFSNTWPNSIILSEMSGTTLKDLLNFRQKFFSKIYVELFAYGNVNKKITLKIHNNVMDAISANFPAKPFYSSEFHEERLVRLPQGNNFLFQVLTHAHNASSAFVSFQTDLVNDRSVARANLLTRIVKNTCRDQLKAKEQLGFSVNCYIATRYSTNMFRFFVIGQHDPSYVDSRIEALIITLEKYLHNLNVSTFDDFKSSQISSYLETPETLYDAADEYWQHIKDRKHRFGLNKRLAENTKNITKGELLKYFKTYLNMKSAKRRKLSIHVKSTLNEKIMKEPSATNLANPAKNLKVKMIHRWDQLKNHLKFYPLPKSHMNLPPLGI